MFALSELVDSDDSGARPAIGLAAAACHGRLSRRNVWGRMLLQGRGVVDQVQVQLEIEGGCTGQMTRAASWRKWTLCFAALLLLNQPHWRCSREAFLSRQIKAPWSILGRQVASRRWLHQRLSGGRPHPPTQNLPQWKQRCGT